MKLISILFLLIFISCEEQQSSETVEGGEPRVTIVEGDDQLVVESSDIQTLLSLNAGDYESNCEDYKVVLIEIKEDWNGERVDVVEMDYSDPLCLNHIGSTFTTFDSEDFYGDYTIEKDGEVYIVDGLEFTLL